MTTALDLMYQPELERRRRQHEESRRQREELFAAAGRRNHPTAADGQIRQRAQATAETMEAHEAERQRQQAEARETAFRERIRRVYIEAGGDAAGFDADWPELRAEIVRRETLAAAEGINPRQQADTGAQRALTAMYPHPPR